MNYIERSAQPQPHQTTGFHFRGQQQTWQMSPEQTNLAAALQAPPAPPPPTKRKQPPAPHRTQKANTFLLIGKKILIIL